jgi:hypothetical protein
MGQDEDHASDYEALEALGEDQVRRELDADRMQGPRAALARSWLRQKEEARGGESSAELLAIARDAKTAALEASRAARHAAVDANAATAMVESANKTATIAMAVSTLGLFLSVVALFLPHAS